VNVGKKLYRIFPMELIVKERLDSVGRAAKITTDTLIIVAANDRIIPYENTKNLILSFKKTQVKVVTFSNVGHNTVHHHPDYIKSITSFMR
jgi:pimeloyl-ACP methyl ester carboxylesterase